MFSIRAIKFAPSAQLSLVLCVACKWASLLARALFLLALASLLANVALGFPAQAGTFRSMALGIGGSFIFDALARDAAAKAGSRARNAFAQATFAKITELGPAYQATVGKSEALNLVGEGAERLRPYFASYIPQFFFALLAPVTLVFLVWPQSAACAVALLVCVPLIPGSIMMLMKRAKKFMGAYWGTYIDLGASFLDAVSGLTTLKVFGADGRAHEALDKEAEGFRRITMKLLRVQLQNVTLMDLFTYAGAALGCGIALVQLAAGAISVQAALTVALLSLEFFRPMRAFGTLFHTGMNGNQVIERFFALLDAPLPAHGTKGCDLSLGTIECEGVSFAYSERAADAAQGAGGETAQGGEADAGEGATDAVAAAEGEPAFALHDISFFAEPMTLTGITGPSGSGKSTFLRLLAGERAAYRGSVRICGTELRELSTEALGQAVTLVGHDSHVFKGSIRSNMQLAKPEASDFEIWNALDAAKVSDFVLAAGGLDAEVAEGGANLSGGQRQRLCLARALLRDTPIYLFDEIASNVDKHSEDLLYQAVQDLSMNKTVVLISHRLSSIEWADNICVFDQGRISEQGSHYALIRNNAAYRNLYAQNRALEETAGLAGEGDEYEPSEAERALAKMPKMMGQVMQAMMNKGHFQRFANNAAAQVPNGHPSWIPLPDSVFDDTRTAKGTGSAEAATSETSGEAVEEVAATEAASVATPETAANDAAPRSVFETIRGLMALTQPIGGELARAVVFGALGNLCAIALFACALFAACNLAGSADTKAVPLALIAAIACLALARGPLHYGERLLTHSQTFKTLALIRSRVFGKLRTLAPARFEHGDTAKFVNVLTSDIEQLEGFYSRAIAPLAATAATLLACLVALAVIHPALALIALLGAVLAGVVAPWAENAAQRDKAQQVHGFSQLMTTFALDSIEGIADLVRFERAGEYANEMLKHTATLQAGERSLKARTALLGALPDLLMLATSAAVALVAAGLAYTNAIAAPAAAVAVALVLYLAQPLTDTAQLGVSLAQTLACANAVLDVLGAKPETPEVRNGAKLGAFQGAQLQNVSFAYGERPVLHELDFQVEAGQAIRITGPSGAGKSTMLKLLMRFWDPDSGTATISGHDLHSASTASLRAHIAYMTQDTYLFAGTLRENITLGKPEATEEEIAHAVENCNLGELVARLPQGLDTPLGGARKLSDGERQRVGLARTLLHDAPLLLLDEPTANLDSLNEAAILQALQQNKEGKTMLIVSHRASVAAICDSAFVVRPLKRDAC